jgi:hypothetical protein
MAPPSKKAEKSVNSGQLQHVRHRQEDLFLQENHPFQEGWQAKRLEGAEKAHSTYGIKLF